MQYEEHRQATHDRMQRFMREAEAERMARRARQTQYWRRRRRAFFQWRRAHA
ncbi:MAG TPA: hypothetical protein VIA10_12735 [Gaiellaceae bacterium]|jgi:hypothetical protein